MSSATMTEPELADLLRVKDRRTVERWAARAGLPRVKVGRLVRYPTERVMEILGSKPTDGAVKPDLAPDGLPYADLHLLRDEAPRPEPAQLVTVLNRADVETVVPYEAYTLPPIVTLPPLAPLPPIQPIKLDPPDAKPNVQPEPESGGAGPTG